MADVKTMLLGVPLDCGKRARGCLMGPDGYRVAGLVEALTDLGRDVTDLGNLSPAPSRPMDAPAPLYKLAETVAWTEALLDAGIRAAQEGFPIFMGGDHALAMGSVAAMAAHASDLDRPLFVLWLDAHPDFHTPHSTDSGNLHGTPMAYVTGRDGFDAFPALRATVDPAHVCMIGLRSVDPAEREALAQSDVVIHDMRAIDEHGIAQPLSDFLDRVRAANGMLHVSLDVDFLDPSIAPAVATTVPGGATFREGHLVMEILHDSGLVTSLDLVELNPPMDERGKTAALMVDLTASLFGRRVFDRPTHRH
ncbi:arginase [Thioclava sp. SK-1]|uniref:arginase n=1 Tax=Thioclava sp. SK-1 TaxID=1889770 RepID=UPI000826074A|nr:arginase [Thioclava sp. SK-1]OCX64523.1 arginase [Thioclava sp. SK-1]